MEVLLRIEVNVIAIVILIFLIKNTRYDTIAMLDDKLFQLLLYASLVSAALDMMTWLLDGKLYTGGNLILTLIHTGYFVLSVLIPYTWLLYVDQRLLRDEGRIKRRNVVYGIPMLIYLGIALTTPFTGWLFYVDQQNVYHRGSFYAIQIALSFLYLLHSSFLAIKTAYKKKLPSERKECYTIAGFILFPLVGAILQVACYGLPMVSITIVFAELSIFINVQNRQISLDALTKINNRGQLNRYLEARVEADRKREELYLLILDIDRFKRINDTYGHKEGDRAIINTANLLKRVCGRYHAFLARYGGDEFAIVLECQSEKTVREMVANIKQEVECLNKKTGQPYELTYSIGYAQLGRDAIVTAEDLIEAADNQMYRKKNNQE